MATQLRAFLAYSAVNSTTQTITKPTSPGTIVSGDLMLIFLIANGSTAPNSVPSGWTLSETLFDSGSVCLYIYSKIAGGSEPSTYTFTWASSILVGGGMVAGYSDASLGLKVDAHAVQTNVSSANRVWPSITITQPNSLACYFGYIGTSSSTPDAACTERWDVGASIRTYLMTELVTNPGVTGTRTATGVATPSKVISIAITEDPPGGAIVGTLDNATLSSTAMLDGVLYRGSSTPNSGTGSTVVLTQDIPGLANGDYMLMALYASSNEATPPQPPAGWTLLESAASGSFFVEVWGRIASGEGGSYTITKNTGSKTYGGIILAYYSATGKTLYLDAHAAQANASSANRTCPGVTTTKASAGLACFFAVATNVASTPAADMTERLDTLFGSGVRVYAMTSILTAAGATGDKVATGTASSSRTVTVAIAESTDISATLAGTLEDATLSATAETSQIGSLAVTLDNATLVATGDVHEAGIEIRSLSISYVETSNSQVFYLPPDVQEGDLLLIHVAINTGPGLESLSGLDGWMLEWGFINGAIGQYISSYLYSKRATAFESSTFTLYFDGTYTKAGALIALYSTVGGEAYIADLVARGSNTPDEGEEVSDELTTNFIFDSVDVPTVGTLLLYLGASTSDFDVSRGSGTIELYDFGDPRMFGAAKRPDGIGPSDTYTATSVESSYNGYALAIAELYPITADLVVTLEDATLDAEGEVSSVETTADLDVTLADATLSSSATALMPISASLDVTLADATLSALAVPAVLASVAVTLEDAHLFSIAHAPDPFEASTIRAVHLYVHKPIPIFQARVNLASPVYPLNALPYDAVTLGAYTDIGPYMFFTVGSTALGDDRGRGRVRYLASSTEISLPYTSRGTRDGELDLHDNDYITVWDDHRIHAKRPYIAPDGETFKDSNIEVEALITRWSFPGGVPTPTDVFGNYNEVIPPVANAGPDFADYIDPDSGVITVEFPGTGNYSFPMADGATIIHYAWDVKDGTITVGTFESATITATFPAGFRWVALTVVDSNGIPHSAWVKVLAVDPDDDVTLKDFSNLSLNREINGQELTFKLLKDLSRADYPDGTFVLLWYDDPTAPSDRSHMIFSGRLYSEASSIAAEDTATLRDTTITCLDAAGQIGKLPGLPQTLSDELLRDEELEPATTWQYMSLPNIDKFFFYLLSYQATCLDNTDVYLSETGADYPFVELQAGGESILGQIQKLPAMIVPDYILTCNPQGQIKVLPDPMLLDVGDRPSEILLTINEEDWNSISWTYNRNANIGVLWGDATLTATNYITVDDDEVISSVRSIAPGAAFGQGLGESTWIQQLAQSQAALNAVNGHRYARINARYGELPISLPGLNPRYLDIASLKWAVLNLSAETAAQRGFESTSVRGLIKSVKINHNFEEEGMSIDVSISVELETSGTPASTWIPGEGVPT